ncbi:hypothetical protein DFR68_10951 [Nocardia mexicana]|uniref:Uncharacterized protein n=1 Tax=Nocardia mexicana TaxID=279262 RepID=A0A370GTN1_9NOCA|nr:hypothetical protein DFR68_10951 [Nocardia mexicana]
MPTFPFFDRARAAANRRAAVGAIEQSYAQRHE